MWIMCTSLVLLAGVDEPAIKSELLPPAPQDWRFERLEFPLDFAPELNHKGFEELRFGPGMFDAASDTYWTYVFAMKITSDVKLDADNLKTILDVYYRGLCRTVGKAREFTIDESKIAATVRPTAPPRRGHFNATIACYDPFTTGKPLILNLEIVTARVGDKDARLFAAVSPRATTDPVWVPLREMKQAFVKKLPKRNPWRRTGDP